MEHATAKQQATRTISPTSNGLCFPLSAIFSLLVSSLNESVKRYNVSAYDLIQNVNCFYCTCEPFNLPTQMTYVVVSKFHYKSNGIISPIRTSSHITAHYSLSRMSCTSASPIMLGAKQGQIRRTPLRFFSNVLL